MRNTVRLCMILPGIIKPRNREPVKLLGLSTPINRVNDLLAIERTKDPLISMADPPRGLPTSEHSSRFLVALLGMTTGIKFLPFPREGSFSPSGTFPRITFKGFRRYGKKIASPVSQKDVSVCEARVTASSI